MILIIVQMFAKAIHKSAIEVQKACLVLGSILYVGYASWLFVMELILFSVVIWGIGQWIGKHHSKNALILGVIFSVGILLIFKYHDFWMYAFPTFSLMMPLGLSYYVFSSITYLVDVYNEKIDVEKNVCNFALFMCFFPKMMAGPIVKAKEFIPQIRKYEGLCVRGIEEGIQIYVFGLFKKMVLADRLGVFVNDVFLAPEAFGTFTVVLAVISYSLQIYFDFSGYSDMAVGVARTLGIYLPANFNMPYLAANVSDFWKRWHISLSSFLREYVYYPLGGNKKGECRTYFNLIIVMLLSGLWHGNGMNYIVWGLLYGIISCLHRWSRQHFAVSDRFRYAKIGMNFLVVSILWIFFRAENLGKAVRVLKATVTIHSGISQMYSWSFVAIIVMIVASIIVEKRDHNGFYPILKLDSIRNITLFMVFCGLTIMFGYFGDTSFIYAGY
ncbi:MAG: MBOAT family O-acyltransferase [Lachnospiraceae bacterium]